MIDSLLSPEVNHFGATDRSESRLLVKDSRVGALFTLASRLFQSLTVFGIKELWNVEVLVL